MLSTWTFWLGGFFHELILSRTREEGSFVYHIRFIFKSSGTEESAYNLDVSCLLRPFRCCLRSCFVLLKFKVKKLNYRYYKIVYIKNFDSDGLDFSITVHKRSVLITQYPSQNLLQRCTLSTSGNIKVLHKEDLKIIIKI